MKDYYTREIIETLFDELEKVGVTNIGWITATVGEYVGEEGNPHYDVLVGPRSHYQGIRLVIYCNLLDRAPEERDGIIRESIREAVLPKIEKIWGGIDLLRSDSTQGGTE